jgi:hypothetical protein
MKILLTILLLFTASYSLDRPYYGFTITGETCTEFECTRIPPVFIGAIYMRDAQLKYQEMYPKATIRCIAEDSWMTCKWRY